MEIVGGFMVMMSIISLFLAVIWLIMPFVVFAIKGKQDRTLEVLEAIEKRMAVLEARLQPVETELKYAASGRNCETSNENSIEDGVIRTESASEKNCSETSL